MKTDILNGLLALKVVAEKGNFTAAAVEMGVSPSAISQTIKQLEKRLETVFLNRTSRSVSLTEVGGNFLQQYQPALEQLIDAIEQLGSSTDKPTGTLRINLPRSCWHTIIAPILGGFQKQFPDIIVDLNFEDSFVDIVRGGFDAGIRLSETTAEDMIAIRISPPFRFVIAGSPDYLKKHGTPKQLNDLLNHNCITYKYADGHVYRKWEFEEKGRDLNVDIKGNLLVNDPTVTLDCALRGFGLIYGAEDKLKEYFESGKLVSVLEKYAPHSDGYYLYYPNISQVSPKLRAFIDYIKAQKNI